MTHYFPSVFPDDSMFDLTPARLEALVKSTDATVAAANKATSPNKRGGRT